ncbi:sensor domain-containing protein [Actinoallomurus sp. NPDC052274]|uniref:sensor histidine kinase n=1 Tax=Actinoallomurus sp. NPDC052274 TaxID=3155420 RepID=UPI00341B7E0D
MVSVPPSRTAWQAMSERRFLLSGWPWRGAAYLATAAVPGSVGLTVIGALITVGGVLSTVLIGIPMLLAAGLAGVPLASAERWRMRLIDPEPAPDPHRVPDRPGPVAWLRTRFREPATRRELAYTLLFVTVLWPLDLGVAVIGICLPLALLSAPIPVFVAGGHRELWPGATISTAAQALAAVPAGLVLLVVAAYLLTGFAAARAWLARALLAPREDELIHKLAEVTRSRERLVRAFEAERRRIERDLHDGAQQRLVALSMSLGLARLDLPPGPAADQVAHAQEQAAQALTELRELIHGIHPQILTDRGLPPAALDVASRSPVPVEVALALPGRLPRTIETTAYFAVCEALANVAKHSGASRAWVTGGLVDGVLVIEIRDNGVGGADAERGSGLTGLTDRVTLVDGAVTLSSPAGGPTVVKVELPCPQTGP